MVVCCIRLPFSGNKNKSIAQKKQQINYKLKGK
jgi:hypothetical protein